MNGPSVLKDLQLCGGENREKDRTGMAFFYAGSVPRKDRLGNGTY
jgi:hypothetical protein